MKPSLFFIRSFFILLSTLLLTGYVLTITEGELTPVKLIVGLGSGLVFGLLLVGADRFFARGNLRAFNVAALGIFFGYLMGQALLLVIGSAIELSTLPLQPATLLLIKVLILLFTVYLGMIFTARAAEELSLSIPFVRFKAMIEKKKDVLIDSSILNDTRVLDLAASGLMDHHIVLPRFVLTELQSQADACDENVKARARRCLEVVKKLEALTTLGLRYTDTDFPEVKDPMLKLVRLARLMDGNILTSDINRVQQSEIEGVRVINIHTLSNALKPITQSGEFLNIKIQRYGKEARQGVGYLEDGTMVVVNGAADFIGDTIKARVLSVKHTSSGRMIFCNTADDLSEPCESMCAQAESAGAASKKYFAL